MSQGDRSRRTRRSDNPRDADSDGIKSAIVNSRQDVFRSCSPLGRASEKVAAAQTCRPVDDAIPNSPRSVAFNMTVESVLVIFDATSTPSMPFGVHSIHEGG